MQWSWDGVTFRVLHPGKGLPYLGNDNSCVISARIGSQGVLLTGDIGHAVERRLVDAGLARHDILFAPHHGSKSSSHGSLIDAVQPRYGLVSSGYRNRFGFPASEVSRRYAERGVTVLNTSDCGAIEIVLSRGRPPELRSARRVRTGPWRWPAAEICP